MEVSRFSVKVPPVHAEPFPAILAKGRKLMDNTPQVPKIVKIADLVQQGELEKLKRGAYVRHHWADMHAAYKGMATFLTAGVGQWMYDPALLTVSPIDIDYPIHLEELTTAAELLDMLLQVSRKPWRTPETLGELVALLEAISNEIFETNLQGVFCPMGESRSVSWPKARGEAEDER
jgi:hypothetical protein